MKKVNVLFLISIISLLLINVNIVFAQFEDDDVFGVEETEVVCIPESLQTAYDLIEYGEVSLNDIRQAYSFGSEYYKNKNSNTLIIAYGIASRVVLPLKNKYSIFIPIRLYPVLENQIKKFTKSC